MSPSAVPPLSSFRHAPSGGTASITPIHRSDAPGGQWWRSAVIYQVYPRSFADASGDGIGDLPGITSRLDHLAKLGVDALWLSPFYASPQRDAGYDVADYRVVDPLFGSLEDFDALLERAHRLSLRVIVDLVPNHTSDEHVWFQAALDAAPGSAERERYMFRDGKGASGAEAPNDWKSVFGGPAWTRLPATSEDPEPQWYLHLFDPSQPDLNWENPEVREEFESVLRFWLDRGVDGFRIDVASGLIKAEGLPDWDEEQHMLVDSSEHSSGGAGARAPMWDQDGVHEVYRTWHQVLAEYDGDRALVAEAWIEDEERLSRYIRHDEMSQAFNFDFLMSKWNAAHLRDVITSSLRTNDSVGAPTTWVWSNHDSVRHTSRLGLSDPGSRPNGIGFGDEQPDEELGLRRARAATLLMLGLPGSAYLYQGEELGLPDNTMLDDELRQDPTWWRSDHTERGRDGCRVPLPWAASEPAFGFSPTGKTWLPQPDSWSRYALDAQRGVDGSTYELYREALRLRRDLALGSGSMAWVDVEPAPVGAESGLAFVNRDVFVMANLNDFDVPLFGDHEILLSSAPLTDDKVIPANTTVWARIAS